jgi:hypothetical protein
LQEWSLGARIRPQAPRLRRAAPRLWGLTAQRDRANRAVKPTRPHCDAVRTETNVSSDIVRQVASWFSHLIGPAYVRGALGAAYFRAHYPAIGRQTYGDTRGDTRGDTHGDSVSPGAPPSGSIPSHSVRDSFFNGSVFPQIPPHHHGFQPDGYGCRHFIILASDFWQHGMVVHPQMPLVVMISPEKRHLPQVTEFGEGRNSAVWC